MYKLQEMDYANFSDEKLANWIDFRRRFLLQLYPNQSLPNFKNWRKHMLKARKETPPSRFYYIMDNGQIIANINCAYFKDVQGKSKFQISVDHDERFESDDLAQCIQTKILALKKEESFITTKTRSAFCKKIISDCGFVKGNEMEFTKLYLSDLSKDLISKWLEFLPSGFSIDLLDDPNHTERNEITKIMTFLLNDMERVDDQITFQITRKDLDNSLERAANNNFRLLHLMLRNDSGALIGLSIIRYKKDGEFCTQYMTGVIPEYRRKGLAKFMKAYLYHFLITKEPLVKYVKTDFYTTNHRMKNLNQMMGFKTDYFVQEWYYKS